MVWKISKKVIICLFAFMMMCECTFINAFAYTPYTQGTISSTYITQFRDLLNKVGVNDDYVMLRSGQYEYVMIVGDLELSSTKITGKSGTEYKFTTSSGNYNQNNIYTVSEVSNIVVELNDTLIYSNLGNYPDLIEKGVTIQYASLNILLIMCICILVGNIFNFTLRSRS